MSGRKVVVIGGGVAGLTVAHELAEKGFSVVVYEQRQQLGGKSRSYPRAQPQPPGPGAPPPAEHGFRFFPGFYKHLPHTMSRIPYKGLSERVVDNLVSTDTNLIASNTRDAVPALASYPRTLEALRKGPRFIPALMDLGLTSEDLTFYFHKLWRVLTACRARRLAEFEKISWVDFMEPASRSPSYDEFLVSSTTRSLLAARAEEANALTIAEISLQLWATLLWYPQRGGDRILNGPTSQSWIDPWVEYLTSLGVRFQLGHRLHSIKATGGRITRVSFRDSSGRTEDDTHRLKAARTRNYEGAYRRLTAELGGTTDAAERARLEQAARATLKDIAVQTEQDFYATFPAVDADADTDYYVFALPVEHMGKFVTDELVHCDPQLAGIRSLKDHVRWMAGVQIYLNQKALVTTGHVNYTGTPWALTSIVQSQFWSDETDLARIGDGSVRAVLSVCISDWKTPGYNGKEAGDCAPLELALEVWEQMKRALNRPNRPAILHDAMLALGGKGQAEGWHLASSQWFALDESLTDRLDAIRDTPISDAWQREFRSWIERNEVGEPDFYSNAEPLFINVADTWRLRPEVGTRLPNMLLAGDYVRTNTNLACMESANESGRRAANEIFRRSGVSAEACKIWELELPFGPLRALDEQRFRAGKPWKNIGGSHIDLILNAGKAGMQAFKALGSFWNAASGKD